MIKYILLVLLSMSFSFSVLAEEHDHTADVCTDSSPQICAHLGHFSAFSVNQEAAFVAHIMTPQNQPVGDLSIDILMPSLGLNSSSVFVSEIGVNKFKVQRVNFTSAGQWLVKLNFTLAGVSYQLSTPVTVSEQ